MIAYETDATATFELLDGSEPVSGTGRGSLTVGAADGAHVTGLRLTVDATEAGNTSFGNLRAIDAPDHDHDHAHDCRDSDDARCAHVEGVVLNKRAAMKSITFGHRDCCNLCVNEPNCTFYSVEAGSGVGTVNDPACFLFDAPTVQRLAEYEADLPTIRTSWVLGRERRGDLCEVCACAEASADCRGRNLKTVPFADDDAIVSLDLRENPLLAVIPSKAFAGLRALEEVLLPVEVAYVAPDAFAPGVARSRQAADGSTVTETAPLFGDLIDAVKWYADRDEGAAGEPPDFAPGTNARRRTALKKPPARPSRLLSAMSFRSTPASVGSAASSRKSYRG